MGFKLKLPKTGIKVLDKKVTQGVNLAFNQFGIKSPLKAPSAGLPGNPGGDEQARIDRYRTEREKDLAAGRARGEEVFKDGTLGRLDDLTMKARLAGTQGFTPEEQNAMRDDNLGALNAQNNGAIRQQRILAAAEGVRGGRAAAQVQKTVADQGAQKAAMERDLFLKNIDARRQGLTDYEAAQKYNTEQKNAELQGRLTTEMGYGALGAADRGAAMQGVVGQQQAAAAVAAAKAGGKGKK